MSRTKPHAGIRINLKTNDTSIIARHGQEANAMAVVGVRGKLFVNHLVYISSIYDPENNRYVTKIII